MRRTLSLALLVATLAACRDVTPPDRRDMEVRIERAPDTLGVGDTARLFAFVAARSDPHWGAGVRWLSRSPSIANIDSAGALEALAVGSAWIVATGTPPAVGISDSVLLHVEALSRTLGIMVARDSVTFGDTITARAIVDGVAAVAEGDLRFSSSDTTIAHVDSLTGLVHVAGDGDATITVRRGARRAQVVLRAYLRPIETGAVRLARITLGWNFGCGTDAAGVGYCWGVSNIGQLGRGIYSTGYVEHPLGPIQTTSRYTDIQAGRAAACGLATTGALECWGATMYGISGRSPAQVSVPVVVPMPTGFGPIATLHVGNRPAACVIDAGGAHACFGSNSYWALGADTTYVNVPRRVPGLDATIRSIATGEGHGCAVTTAGALRCWGWVNSWGSSASAPPAGTILDVATVPSPSRVEANWDGTCVLDVEGVPWCGGTRFSSNVWSVRALTRMGGAPAFARMHSNAFASCGLAADAALYCWDGLRTAFADRLMFSEAPTVFSRRETRFIDFGVGAHGICGLTADGRVLCRTIRFGQQ